MKGTTSQILHVRAVAAYVSAGALAVCLAAITCDGAFAAKGNGRPIQAALSIYHLDYFGPGTTYGSTESEQRIGFPESSVPVELTDLKFYPLTSPAPWLPLPAPGTAPVERVLEQRVTARLEFGPGSDPFWIDSFFDITYRVTNSGSSPQGPFAVEVLAGELIGYNPLYMGGVKIRVNPLASSSGEHRIVPNSDGTTFTLTSFFDVWTELSLDGGPYVPADEEFRVGYVPEPASVAMAIMGAMSLAVCRRLTKRQRQ